MQDDNPFEVTKAVDFSDEEIAQTWVDLPGGGFQALAPPRSPMPRFLVGGKGGGRTHLMRYYSFPLQRLRHQDNLLEGVLRDGYVGIYLRCSGLNASRFAGKGSESDTWAAVFAHYLDVWLGRLVVNSLAELEVDDALDEDELASFVHDVTLLFTGPEPGEVPITDLDSLSAHLRSLQRSLDSAVNNAALTRRLDLNISTNPGALTFGIPALALRAFTKLTDVRVAYLIDEFENLSADQQMYVNTLVREKELPSTFLIGSRLWGIKTHRTLSGDEENKLGSEFELTVLENTYQEPGHNYAQFCKEIVRRRLEASNIGAFREPDVLFEVPMESSLEERASALCRDFTGESPPWISQLRESLLAADLSVTDTDRIAQLLALPDDPLGEKYALLMYYRLWADGVDLNAAASRAAEQASERHAPSSKVRESYKHYRKDLYAQILQQLGRSQEYYGLDTFVQVSGYLPRNLLIVLKQVTRWASFLDDRPFQGGQISMRAQTQGVLEASKWFLSDATGLGRLGADSQRSIRRLGEYLASHRFSQKPVEVECSQIEVNPQTLSESSAECLREAVTHSLLLEAGVGRRDRNTGAYHQKYQLNPMLAPLFALPVVRRGSLSLGADDVNAIFDRDSTDLQFARSRDRRIGELSAPFGQKPGQGKLQL